MASVRVVLLPLVLLTWALLLVSVRAWEPVNELQPRRFEVDFGMDESSEEDENEFLEADDGDEFEADSDDSEPLAEDGDAGYGNLASGTSQSSTGINVVCSSVGFQITLLTGSLSQVRVLGSTDILSVMDAPESCGYEVYSLNKTVIIPFTGCHVNRNEDFSLQLLYVDEFGQTQVATPSCEDSPKSDLSPRLSGQTRLSVQLKRPLECSNPVTSASASLSKSPSCVISQGERIACGDAKISRSECEQWGCCVSCDSHCYYPLDVCTVDEHFVFAIRTDSSPVNLDPAKLVIPGSQCYPVIVNENAAIFKFKITDCGTHSYVVGGTKIYLAEVQTVVKALRLKYGIITRSEPNRFLIECRYDKTGPVKQALASIGYMVKTPMSSLPSKVHSSAKTGVQLRIATDHTYLSFHPTYHQPLRRLLGQPVFLELYLEVSRPGLVIIVNYCIAYPRSATDVLVLIYEGCANPHDPTVHILQVADSDSGRRRRFKVDAFQFLDPKTHKYLDEEIYFMCSTELCLKTKRHCEEWCFGQA